MRLIKEYIRHTFARLQTGILRLLSSPWPERGHTSATLIIAPHPDDEILGCGLLLAGRIARSETIHLAFLTDGSGSHPGHPLVDAGQMAEKRKQEVFAVADFLGLPRKHLHFLGVRDGKLNVLSCEEGISLQHKLEDILRQDSFDEVFTPLYCDGSTEHEAAYLLVRKAVPENLRLLQYPVWARWAPWRISRALAGFPRIYRINSPEDHPIKQKALTLYQTQVAPLAPWKSAVLSGTFLDLFKNPDEFYFDYKNGGK